MAHELDMTNGRANIAYLGSRNNVWHRLGQEMQAGMSTADWARAAGLDWTAVKVPAVAALTGPAWDHIPANKRFWEVEGQRHVCRSDNGTPLGYVSDEYQPVQPAEVLAWFERYISVDDRFHLDVAGSLKGGKVIWATAKFNGDLDVVGDAHTARLLMTTSFDGSSATVNQATMTRVVCQNTLRASLTDKRAIVRTRHSTRFDADKVARELATIAEGFDSYKKMAEAMVRIDMSAKQVSDFFKACLEIPFDAKADDISTRKMNQFKALSDSYSDTVREGTKALTGWTALNAVTRYVDHDRSTRGNGDKSEAQFLSANFGSGDALKAKAIGLLMPDLRQPELVAA